MNSINELIDLIAISISLEVAKLVKKDTSEEYNKGVLDALKRVLNELKDIKHLGKHNH